MTEDAGSDRIDNYRACCPWLMLTRTFRYATGLQVLLLAALGALGNAAGWRIAASLTLDDVAPVPVVAAEYSAENSETAGSSSSNPLQPVSKRSLTLSGKGSDPFLKPLGQDVEYLGAWPGLRSAPVCPFIVPRGETNGVPLVGSSWSRLVRPPADPMVSIPYRMVRPFAQLLNRSLSPRHYAYYLLGGAWTLVLWSFFGAAITRMATLQFGRDQRISIGEALAHARSKMGAHLAACVFPVAITLVVALVLTVMGLLARWSLGATLVGALWFIPLVASTVMAVVLTGLLFGWPLIWGAISTERSDSFDGMSRAYDYAFHRPLKYLSYVALAAIVGYFGWLLVWLISELVIQLGIVTVGAGAGSQRMAELLGESATDSALIAAGGFLAGFWNGVIRTLASAYGYAYFWCAMAGIYLLLRLDVDATELDEVSTDDAPGRFGESPLKNDPPTTDPSSTL